MPTTGMGWFPENHGQMGSILRELQEISTRVAEEVALSVDSGKPNRRNIAWLEIAFLLTLHWWFEFRDLNPWWIGKQNSSNLVAYH